MAFAHMLVSKIVANTAEWVAGAPGRAARRGEELQARYLEVTEDVDGVRVPKALATACHEIRRRMPGVKFGLPSNDHTCVINGVFVRSGLAVYHEDARYAMGGICVQMFKTGQRYILTAPGLNNGWYHLGSPDRHTCTRRETRDAVAAAVKHFVPYSPVAAARPDYRRLTSVVYREAVARGIPTGTVMSNMAYVAVGPITAPDRVVVCTAHGGAWEYAHGTRTTNYASHTVPLDIQHKVAALMVLQNGAYVPGLGMKLDARTFWVAP